jgi:hypothetical protein
MNQIIINLYNIIFIFLNDLNSTHEDELPPLKKKKKGKGFVFQVNPS